MMRKLLAVMAVAVLAFAAVGKTQAQTAVPGKGEDAFAFLNLAPDVGAVDLLINGEAVATAVDYKQASKYVVLPIDTSATYTIAVVPTGEKESAAIYGPDERGLTSTLR